ncbi:MAG TPA: hypothetical protein VMY37_30910 [Thermoguttaceae bacterium]|nr:hypothetical protein [Thermoguttaceae bacterium]
MLRCREVSKLVSESMERKLPFGTRMQVWMHLMLCRFCAGFARQVRFLRRAARQSPERLAGSPSTPETTLSQEARERIKAALRGNNGS